MLHGCCCCCGINEAGTSPVTSAPLSAPCPDAGKVSDLLASCMMKLLRLFSQENFMIIHSASAWLAHPSGSLLSVQEVCQAPVLSHQGGAVHPIC